MISNLSNDYFGFRRGHDTPDSPRMRYTVHPLASGVLEKRTLLRGLAILVLIGGGFAMITGQLSPDVLFASVPYGLGVMTILNGKHIDQLDFDSERHIRTLPVLIGELAARVLNIIALIAIYAMVATLIALGRLTPFGLAAAAIRVSL
jgi:1,4-dihydroxy-2-naphthoate polyprenyltransferase